MLYGVSIAICFSKFKELYEPGNLEKTYLNFVDHLTEICRKKDFRCAELASFPACDFGVLSNIEGDIRDRTSDLDLSFHLPSWDVHIGSLTKRVREASVSETKDMIGLAYKVGAKRLVMHPGAYDAISEIYHIFGNEARQNVYRVVEELNEMCTSRKMVLCAENLPSTEPMFQKPEEFVPMVSRGVKMMVDTAHAVTSGVKPSDFVRRFGEDVGQVHLVDGFRDKKDVHYALGDGETDFREFFGSLREVGFEGPSVFELKSEQDLDKSIEFLKRDGLF